MVMVMPFTRSGSGTWQCFWFVTLTYDFLSPNTQHKWDTRSPFLPTGKKKAYNECRRWWKVNGRR